MYFEFSLERVNHPGTFGIPFEKFGTQIIFVNIT